MPLTGIPRLRGIIRAGEAGYPAVDLPSDGLFPGKGHFAEWPGKAKSHGKGVGGGRGGGGRGGGPPPPPEPTPQPSFSNVRYLPDHQNAAHLSTAIADLATGGVGNPHSLGFYQNIRNDTGNSAFGSGSSILFDGSGGSINRGYHADFAPISAESKDTAEFCWEFHINRTGQGGTIYSRYYATQSARCWRFGLTNDSDGRIYINGYQDGVNIWVGAGTSTGTTVGQWHHFACSRQNGVSETPGEEDIIRLFLDGIGEASLPIGATEGFTPGKTNVGPYFGDTRDGGNRMLARLDNIRLVMGEPVYTENFNPPTERHPTS